MLALVCLVSGCAAGSFQELQPRPIRPGAPHAEAGTPKNLPAQSHETGVGTVREPSAGSRPGPQSNQPMELEAQDSGLLAALKAMGGHATGENHRLVAEAYRRLGVLDAAHRHLTDATDLDRTDGAAYDGLARIWRDWGFAPFGLGDAYRAVYFAPTSAAARNTLGTLLQATGDRQAARQAYERALALDPRAAYALNNLCYLSFLEGEHTQALELCRAALRVDPGLAAAHNNLALVYASAGCIDCAGREFSLTGDAAATQYNLGIVYLAERDHARAASAFDAAAQRGSLGDAARARARQARTLSTPFRNGEEQH